MVFPGGASTPGVSFALLFAGCFVASYYAADLQSFSRPFKVVYPTRPEHRSALWVAYVRAHWTKIALAAAVGMLFGFIAGVVSSRAGALFTPVVYAAASAPGPASVASKPSAPTAAHQAAQDELTRLRAQNEQLASMVAELKKNAPAAHGRRAVSHHRRHTRAHA
jgi:hypothetical protein